jgi:hypothetical protein
VSPNSSNVRVGQEYDLLLAHNTSSQFADSPVAVWETEPGGYSRPVRPEGPQGSHNNGPILDTGSRRSFLCFLLSGSYAMFQTG